MAGLETGRTTGRAPARSPAAVAQAGEAAWAGLSGASTTAQLAGPWLRIQLQQTGAEDGAVFVTDATGGGGLSVLAEATPLSGQVLSGTAMRACESGQPVTERPEDAPNDALIAHPLIRGRQTLGAAVIRISGVSPPRLRTASRALQWGVAWLREALALEHFAAGERQLAAMRAAHEVFGAAHDDHRFRAAALGTVTRLAHLATADRASLGFVRRGRTEIAAISHSAEFGKRMTLTRHVGAAMDEAIEQRAALSHPEPEGEINATRAQGELARSHGPSAVLTVPFMVGDAHRGAICFQRPEDRLFTPDEVALLDFAVSLVGPTLWEKRQNDKALIFKAGDTLWNQTVALIGPGHAARKLTVIALVALVALFSTWSGSYRTASDAVVEGALERSLVAPFDGFIRKAPLRAGDTVAEDALIAALDDRDLALERLRWKTERRQKALEYGQAIGEQNRSESEIIRTQIAQADAQLRLIDAQLARAKILAPFDGIIVSGDQSQNIGGAVSRGDLLFEVAPVDNYRVVIDVDEARIGDIRVGQTGELVVTALPKIAFPIVVKKLTPVAVSADGRNFFRTEARLTGPTAELSPGMQGVAKIEIDERLMIQIWTRSFVDWVRLTWWAWFG